MTVATTTALIADEGGRRFDGHLAWPQRVTGPGILVLTEMFGVNTPMRDVADSYARRGHPALVPNLFWRSEITRAFEYDLEHEPAWKRLAALDLDAAAHDVQAAAAWLRARPSAPETVAAIGFCGGGRVAFLAATRTDVDAAASLYGLGIASHLDELDRVRCPLQLHYGLVDRHIPRTEIDAVAAAVQGHRCVEAFLYPEAGHSFCNPVRPTYDTEAATLAGERIDAMLAAL